MYEVNERLITVVDGRAVDLNYKIVQTQVKKLFKPYLLGYDTPMIVCKRTMRKNSLCMLLIMLLVSGCNNELYH